ncbi:MAG: PHB depolymerase family esterase [Polaromonas sp.]|nr:PHB depolymerase family esterase [Polaromonas sp.]
MPKSLSSLWLKSIRRMGKAQQAQGRQLLKSLTPKPPPKTAVKRALKLVTAPALRPKAAGPARPVRSLARPPAARAVSGLAGSWQKSWFTMPGASQYGTPRRMLYWLYLPAGASLAPRPLVVMLHGCQQTATDFATSTRMNELAERKGFAVLYPQQSASADSHRCWHWYTRATQEGEGDVRLIASMMAQVQAKHGLDASRTYVAGLSAGAGLANILALRYPQQVAALGLHSAPVFGVTDSPMSAYRVMQQGAGPSYVAAASALHSSVSPFPGMPAIVIHGDSDSVVRKINMAQVMEQLGAVNSPAINSSAPVLRTYAARSSGRSPRHAYKTATWYAGRKAQLVSCEIRSLGHAWSGGDASVEFSAPEGPDASLLMWTFFARHRRVPLTGQA